MEWYEQDDTLARLKGCFRTLYRKALENAIPDLTIADEGLEHLDKLMIRLLVIICACLPHTVADVEEYILDTFPNPIDESVISEARGMLEKGKKRSHLSACVDKFHSVLQKDILCYKIDQQLSLYVITVADYLICNILKLTGTYIRNIKHTEIGSQDIKIAMFANNPLQELFNRDVDQIHEEMGRDTFIPYETLVKELLLEEQQFIRDLNLITKIFREPFITAAHLFSEREVQRLFSNVDDIYEFSVSFLGLLEDTIEMADNDTEQYTQVGDCFLEMAEAEEFSVYDTYCTSLRESSKVWSNILQKPEVLTYCQYIGAKYKFKFKEGVQYILPKLLIVPIQHCLKYFDFIDLLAGVTVHQEDHDNLEQALGILRTLQIQIKKTCDTLIGKRRHYGDAFECLLRPSRRRTPMHMLYELEEAIDAWERVYCIKCHLEKSAMDRTLDGLLQEQENATILRLPDPKHYRFAIPDKVGTDGNIVLEENKYNPSGVPLVKGGTILKLVERLTYHKYSGLNYQDFSATVRDEYKKFKKEYLEPVQLRVLNVLRQWVDHHFYDFAKDEILLDRLKEMVESKKGKSMRKWIESIVKIINRKEQEIYFSIASDTSPTFDFSPPPIEWYIARKSDQYSILTLHPVEIARQLTLIESELFRAVKPSELVGVMWTKPDKDKLAPNVLQLIQHSTLITHWCENEILKHENLEERTAVVLRFIEVLMVFEELNNLNGILEIASAIGSSPVHRLEHTFKEIPPKRLSYLKEMLGLTADHFRKYNEKLRSVNPPCIPFMGKYLTEILHTEEGNPDFLPTSSSETIINFHKRRKVADIVGEIQQFQNVPYCLREEPSIKRFLTSLDPTETKSKSQFEDYLYEQSLKVEPRDKTDPPKFSRRTDVPLKSPGIKIRSNSLTGMGIMTSNPIATRRTSGSGGRDSIRSFSEAVNQGSLASKKRTLSRSRGSNFEFLTSTSQPDAFLGRGAVRSLSLPIDPNIKLLKGNRIRTVSNSSIASTEPITLFENEYESSNEIIPPVPPRKSRSASSSDIHRLEVVEDKHEVLTRHLSFRGHPSGDSRLPLPIQEEVIFDENDQQDKPPPLPPKPRQLFIESTNPQKADDTGVPPPLPPRDFSSTPCANTFFNVHFMDNGDVDGNDVDKAPLPPPRLLNRSTSKTDEPPPPLPPRPAKA
ncbi:uncharacterized protein TRIADDRAFT_62057 [Trichoplax adhaerens]|uniref:Ras-GEF domain-containing protein n=1 Tax=Trichoplax adhaerens TaxID=10228 RepID=B3SCQ2_TRIAD|nr:hypothetical protein TRIADDRAFT_62057 [Trichoplax adhaerens]EDV19492.1 hypothetical protein TRIADDRAFT_62057 [Trichoplax adhaerens]|eukprot:XP_002118009.1 hypothetical protein TRIADDRAFT_62057 [Trichoplax adhaerens]